MTCTFTLLAGYGKKTGLDKVSLQDTLDDISDTRQVAAAQSAATQSRDGGQPKPAAPRASR